VGRTCLGQQAAPDVLADVRGDGRDEQCLHLDEAQHEVGIQAGLRAAQHSGKLRVSTPRRRLVRRARTCPSVLATSR
jgi:hypothetical protein